MISIIIPCYNEEEIIEDFISELEVNISKINQKFEIIFIDNKSVDLTVNKIKANIKKFENCKIIKLSNYFGKESAILAGIDNSNGSACIIIPLTLFLFTKKFIFLIIVIKLSPGNE